MVYPERDKNHISLDILPKPPCMTTCDVSADNIAFLRIHAHLSRTHRLSSNLEGDGQVDLFSHFPDVPGSQVTWKADLRMF